MTRLDFLAECGKRLIDPAVALENDDIAQALKERDDDKVRQLLDSEF